MEIIGKSNISAEIQVEKVNDIKVDGIPVIQWLNENTDRKNLDVNKITFYYSQNVYIDGKDCDDISKIYTKNEMGQYAVYYYGASDTQDITDLFIGHKLFVQPVRISIDRVNNKHGKKFQINDFEDTSIQFAFEECVQDIKYQLENQKDRRQWEQSEYYQRLQEEGKLNEHRVSRIARNVIAAQGKNIFEDFFTFYSDGKWTIEVIRKIIAFLNKLNTISKINEVFPSLQEYAGYLQQVKLEQMSTTSVYKELNKSIINIKKTSEDYNKQTSEYDKVRIMEEYKKELNSITTFIRSYESSCVNIFRNRFVEDEDNVTNLLDTIRESGDYVFNSGK